MISFFALAAFATDAFDPTSPDQVFTGSETWDQDETVQIWGSVERFSDPDRELFTPVTFNQGTRWADTFYSPWIRTMFGSATPATSEFLLHRGVNLDGSRGTPILFVPGAGDNASRGFVTMASHMDRINRPVYAITFPHPHQDVFQQAELIADAIAVIRHETGATQVDVVAHSKGGVAAVVYASSVEEADWGGTQTANAYEHIGTRTDGDIRRLVLIATPLGGIDTGYRWSANNLFSLDADTALAPASWDTYCQYSWDCTDLGEQDFLPDQGDLFPGQRQLLARQDYDLPGSQTWLGGYAVQPDWYTTYEGGVGFVSVSSGIDVAIDAGGGLIGRLLQRGVDPRIEVALLAGSNPLMPNGDAALADLWGDVATEEEWASFLEDVSDHGTPVQADEDELDGLQRGLLICGEVTGPSDGLVFESSALLEAAVDARGARVIATKTANLSHIDLLYASPITGQLLIDAADDEAENAWMRGVGARYSEEDTIGWVDEVLADPEVPDTGDTGDTDVPGDTDPADTDRGPDDSDAFVRPCGGCDAGRAPIGVGVLFAAGLLIGRRRVTT